MVTTDVARAGILTPQKVMIGGRVVMTVVVWVLVQAFEYGAIDPVAMVLGVLFLITAGLVAARRRWALITATVLTVLLFLFDAPVLVQRLVEPAAHLPFAVGVTGMIAYLSVLGAAVVALRRSRRIV